MSFRKGMHGGRNGDVFERVDNKDKGTLKGEVNRRRDQDFYGVMEANEGFEIYMQGSGKNDKEWEQENLEDEDLQDVNLENANLRGAKFNRANLSKCLFKNNFLEAAQFVDAILESINLDQSELNAADFSNAKMRLAKLTNTDLNGAKFIHANLEQADFKGANCHNADFRGANLYYADFNDTDLSGANFNGAHFFPKKELLPDNLGKILDDYRDLYHYSGCLRYLLNDMAADLIRKIRGIEPAKEKRRLLKMASEHPLFASYSREQSLFLIYDSFTSFEQEKKYKKRTKAAIEQIEQQRSAGGEENKKAVEYHGTKSDWKGVQLTWTDLSKANFSGANLEGASFSGSDLSDAIFSPFIDERDKKEHACQLQKAKFNYASLKRANFLGGELLDAEFKNADLSSANFTFAAMQSAKMTGSRLVNAILIETDLSGADLQNADLSHALLWHTNLKNAVLTGAKFTGAHFFPKPEDLTVAELKKFLKKYEKMYLKGGIANNIKQLRSLMREDLLKKIYEVYINRGIGEAEALLKIFVTHPMFMDQKEYENEKDKKSAIKKLVLAARKEMLENFKGVVKASKELMDDAAYNQFALVSDISKLDVDRLGRLIQEIENQPEKKKQFMSLSVSYIVLINNFDFLPQFFRDLSGIEEQEYKTYPGELYINLRGADLRGANLNGVNLTHFNLCNANLQGVDLTGTQFFVDDDLVENIGLILDSYQLHYSKSGNLPILQHAMALDLINKIRDIEPLQNKKYLLEMAMRHPLFASYKNSASPFIAYKKIVNELNKDEKKSTKAAKLYIAECKKKGKPIEFHGNYIEHSNPDAFRGAELAWMDIPNADFRGAILMVADFSGSILRGARFSPYDISTTNTKSIFVSDSDVKVAVARLDSARFNHADLTGANFQSALMSETEFNYANLTTADLSHARMISAEMREANLTGAKLVRTNFTRASLEGSSFKGANLTGAHFANADMKNVNLMGANLQFINLNGANLEGVNFKNAYFFPDSRYITEQKIIDLLDFYNRVYLNNGPSNNLKLLRKLMRRELFDKIAAVYNESGFVAANQLLTIAMRHPYFTKHRNGVEKKNKPSFSQHFFREGQLELYQHLKARVEADHSKKDIAAYANWALVSDVTKLDKERVAEAISYASEPSTGFTPSMKRGLQMVQAYLEGDNELLARYLKKAQPEHPNHLPVNLINADIADYDFSQCDLRNAYLFDADLSRANLIGADLRGVVLGGAKLEGVRFFPYPPGLVEFDVEFDSNSLIKYLDLYFDWYVKSGIDINTTLFIKLMRNEVIENIKEIHKKGAGYIEAQHLLSLAEKHPLFTTDMKTLQIGKGNDENKRIFAALRKELRHDLQLSHEPSIYIHTALFTDISKNDMAWLQSALDHAQAPKNNVAPNIKASMKATHLAFAGDSGELWHYLRSEDYQQNVINQNPNGDRIFPNFQGADLSNFDFSAINLCHINLFNANLQGANFRQARFIQEEDLKPENLGKAFDKLYKQYAKSSNFDLLRKAILNSLLSRLRNEDLPEGMKNLSAKRQEAILKKALAHPLFAGHRHGAKRTLNKMFAFFGEYQLQTKAQDEIKEVLEKFPKKHKD